MTFQPRGRHVAGLVGALALAGMLITGFEDRGGRPALHVYPDPVTHGAPWTYCDGETAHPKVGHAYTNAECDAETVAEITTTDGIVMACVGRPLPDQVRAAFDSLAWNIGTGGFCRSSIVRLARAGDLKGACNAIPLYNRAGGRVIPGLSFRRGEEQQICLEGAAR